MSSDPYGDVVALVLVLAVALFLAAVIWLLVRKYRAEHAHSMDCTPPKLASPRSTPMLSSSPQQEDGQQRPSPAPTPADKEASAVKTTLTPTVDTSHVLSRDLSTTGKSPNRPCDAPSRPESDSRSCSGPSSYVVDRDDIPVTPLDHAKEQALMRDYHEDVAMKTEDERKALSEAGAEHVALGKLSVPGDHAMTSTLSEVQEQHKERHQASKEVRKRKSRKTSRSSVDKATIGSVRRQRKHHLQEAPSEVDAAKPSACGQPELTSRPLQGPAEGALIATPGSVITAASTAVAATAAMTAVVSTEDAAEVRTDERPSRKSRAVKSPRRKYKRRSSTTSIPADRDANGKPSAAGRRGPALPTAIAVPAASFGKTTTDAAAQDPFKAAASSAVGSASLTSLPRTPALSGNAVAENTASSHPSPVSFSTAAQTPGGGTDDLYKMVKASPQSIVKGTSEADFAPLASGSATAPIVKTSTDDLSYGASTDPAIYRGPATNCLAGAPVSGTASSLGAGSPVDKKGVA
ncbi:hypothetical protein MTO96_030509 [Rhipicephalus appendiculatus]